MYISGFDKDNRPPYFHWHSYEPRMARDNAFATANLIRDHIPDLRGWIYDRLLVHGQQEIKNPSRREEFEHTLNAAREYDRTTLYSDAYQTIVTHLYVCELLAQSLICFFDREKPHGHGYRWHSSDHLYAASIKDGKGIARSLHELFYAQPMVARTGSDCLPTVEEFMRFLPELKSMYPSMDEKPPFVFSCEENYGGTALNANPNKDTYHSVHIDDFRLTNPSVGGDLVPTGLPKIFPELTTVYTISNRFSSIGMSESSNCDSFISVTHDVNGAAFAMGFGTSEVPKMRDVEIRYYLLFVLGSIARYDVQTWNTIKKQNSILHYKILRFLEHNQIIFPLLILRYLSGRTYSFNARAVLH